MRSARGPQPYGRLKSRVEVNQWWSSRVNSVDSVASLICSGINETLRSCDADGTAIGWWPYAPRQSTRQKPPGFLSTHQLTRQNRNLSRDHDATFAFHRSGKAIADPGDADLWVYPKVTRAVDAAYRSTSHVLRDVFFQVQRRGTSPRGKTESLDHDMNFTIETVERLIQLPWHWGELLLWSSAVFTHTRSVVRTTCGE